MFRIFIESIITVKQDIRPWEYIGLPFLFDPNSSVDNNADLKK